MSMAYVENILAQAENQEFVNRMYTLLDSDAEAARIVEASSTPESLYQVLSKYIKTGYEQFKEALDHAVAYFTESKAALDDDTLECVVGGGLGSWLKQHWKGILAVTAGVVLTATGVGALVGATFMAVGAATVAAAGFAVSTAVGATAAGVGVVGAGATAGGIALIVKGAKS